MIRRDRERDSVRDDPGPVRYDRASPGLPRSANALPAYPAAGLVCRLALASSATATSAASWPQFYSQGYCTPLTKCDPFKNLQKQMYSIGYILSLKKRFTCYLMLLMLGYIAGK